MEARGREVIGGEDLHDRNDQRRAIAAGHRQERTVPIARTATAVITEAEIWVLIGEHAQDLCAVKMSKERVLSVVSRLYELAVMLPDEAFQRDPSILPEDEATA
jgi:hypothetical protein